MAGINRHIIEKQFVELNVISTGDGFTYRNELENICKNELIPEIEKLFDSIIPEDKFIRLENLEIDVGTISSENWKEDLVENVIREISEKIEMMPDENFANDDQTNPFVNEEENNQNIFFFFLENGSLPWYSGIKSRDEFNSLIGELLKAGDERYWNKLKEHLKKKKKSLNRFIFQLDESELKRFSRKMFSEKDQDRTLKIFQSVFNFINLSNELSKEILYRNWFEVLLNKKYSGKDTGLLRETYHGILSSRELEKDPGLRTQFINSLNEQLKNNGESELMSEQVIKNIPIKEINISDKENELTYESEFYINNSGLILLHPFLVKLFENTGYIENKEWVSNKLQQRAIALIHYAVNGEEEYPEFHLMLNKVLCGYEIPESLPVVIKLSEFEKNEADDLLSSVIGHWAALKNTSINGLRETFLLRNGKLTKDQSGWLLQVEDKTADILMNKLPWGISVIKLPWMKDMLRVEWNY